MAQNTPIVTVPLPNPPWPLLLREEYYYPSPPPLQALVLLLYNQTNAQKDILMTLIGNDTDMCLA